MKHVHFDENHEKYETFEVEEVKEEDIVKKQYSPFWGVISNKVLMQASNKSFFEAAYEGGHRLARRDENIYTAFTFGKKLDSKNLDDPYYRDNILKEIKDKARRHKRKNLDVS